MAKHNINKPCVCRRCGDAFLAGKSNAKWCPSCRVIVKKMRNRGQKIDVQDSGGDGGCSRNCLHYTTCRELPAFLPVMCERIWPSDVQYARQHDLLDVLLEARPAETAEVMAQCGSSSS